MLNFVSRGPHETVINSGKRLPRTYLAIMILLIIAALMILVPEILALRGKKVVTVAGEDGGSGAETSRAL